MRGGIPVSDGTGEIDAIGAGVTRWKDGDRVMAMFAPERPVAEQVVLPETALVKVPDYVV